MRYGENSYEQRDKSDPRRSHKSSYDAEVQGGVPIDFVTPFWRRFRYKMMYLLLLLFLSYSLSLLLSLLLLPKLESESYQDRGTA